MTIELIGLSGARIQSNSTTILLCPASEKSELKASRYKADCVVLGNPEEKVNIEPRQEKLFTISSAGEYEAGGVFIYATQTPATGAPISLMSLVAIEGITIAHLANLNHGLSSAQSELFEGADILLVPVGNKDVLDAKRAKQMVEQIEPRIVIPMHFNQKGIKTAYDGKDKFFKEIGSAPQEQDRIKITKKDLPQETMEIINLSV